MNVDRKYLLLVLCFCALSVSVISVNRRSYEEECDRTHKCDKAAWLSCRDGKCDCSKSDEMLYDNDKGKCVTKSGERCRYGGADSEEILVEITDCVPNSNCSADGVCECDSKYHETYNGTCGLSLLFGEKCSEEDQCSKFVGLHCVDSKCECKDGTYSGGKGLCVGLSQSSCVRNECVDGATCVQGKCLCDSEHFHSSEKTCLPKKKILEDCDRDVECLQTDTLKLRCILGQCSCPDKLEYSFVQKYAYSVYNRFPTKGGYKPFPIGFTGPFVEMCAPRLSERCPDGYCIENAFCDAEVDGSYTGPIYGSCRCINEQYLPNKSFQYCARTYDHECSVDSDCIDDLVCSAGKCNCPSPKHQSFDDSTNTCVTKIGGHCTTASTCVRNSHCAYLSSSSRSGHCKCDADFVVNEDRNCELSYGENCIEGEIKCDTFAGLLCVNGKCSCPDSMYEYNARFRKCLGLVGDICDKSEENIVCEVSADDKKPGDCHAISQSKLVCIENAYCKDESPFQRCDCVDGYVETDNHTCVSAEMESRYEEVTHSLGRSNENSTKRQEIKFDEGACNLRAGHAACVNGQCIRNEWVCDGIVQCDDSSDEMNCPPTEHPHISYATVTECDATKWTCRSGQCIKRQYFCDNKGADCGDGSDEPDGCQQTSECGEAFKCFTGGCIERGYFCDGIKHCEDGSDETICAI